MHLIFFEAYFCKNLFNHVIFVNDIFAFAKSSKISVFARVSSHMAWVRAEHAMENVVQNMHRIVLAFTSDFTMP